MQHRPENVAAAVNGLLVLLFPVMFVLIGGLLNTGLVSNTSTTAVAGDPARCAHRAHDRHGERRPPGGAATPAVAARA